MVRAEQLAQYGELARLELHKMLLSRVQNQARRPDSLLQRRCLGCHDGGQATDFRGAQSCESKLDWLRAIAVGHGGLAAGERSPFLSEILKESR
jgi:hypothetical protein